MLLGILFVDCNRTSKPSTPGCCDRGDPGRGGETGSESRAALEAGTAAVTPAASRFRKEEGCARDFKSSGTAREDVVSLERLCAQGMASLLSEPASAIATAAGIVEVPFKVTSPACLRGAVVAATGGLSFSLVDPRGASLASASSTEPVGVVPVDGTVCVREPGGYRAVVRLSAPPVEAASVTVQIWQASRD
jgi:hypothetical protein